MDGLARARCSDGRYPVRGSDAPQVGSMTYRTFLVAVDQTAESDARVRFACDLAESFEGHLVGACGVSLEASPLEDGCTGGAMLGNRSR